MGEQENGSAPAVSGAMTVPSNEDQFSLEQLWDQLRQKDAQVQMLQKKLTHIRQWLVTVHSRVQALHPPTLKNAKRLYIGNVPANVTDDEMKAFLNRLMVTTGACVTPGKPVISCKVTSDKNYAFIELRSPEETTNALAFDGVAFNDAFLKIRRPSNYDPMTAVFLGPVVPDPTVDTSQLEICRSKVEDSPHKLFIGGLPCDWSDDQVKELLLPYGHLQSFSLVMDKTSGKSKGYAFCEYADESVTDFVVSNLNGRRQGSKVLTVKRAKDGARPPSESGAAMIMPQAGMMAATGDGYGRLPVHLPSNAGAAAGMQHNLLNAMFAPNANQLVTRNSPRPAAFAANAQGLMPSNTMYPGSQQVAAAYNGAQQGGLLGGYAGQHMQQLSASHHAAAPAAMNAMPQAAALGGPRGVAMPLLPANGSSQSVNELNAVVGGGGKPAPVGFPTANGIGAMHMPANAGVASALHSQNGGVAHSAPNLSPSDFAPQMPHTPSSGTPVLSSNGGTNVAVPNSVW